MPPETLETSHSKPPFLDIEIQAGSTSSMSFLSPMNSIGSKVDRWSLRPDLEKHIGFDGDLSAERPVVADDQ